MGTQGRAGEDMLTIGAFARASRLSPKALRLYDELALLPPARVDPATGYRYYAPDQLDRARTVAWLRRLGMPLARIRRVVALEATAAAREIRAFWAEVEADTAVRRDLATFLVGQLSQSSRKDTDMTGSTIELRCAALSDRGLVRSANQDAVHAGTRVLAVADGFGPSGGPASAAAVAALVPLEDRAPSDAFDGELGVLGVLADAVREAHRTVGAIARAHPSGEESGTTLTALVQTGAGLALVHIGDSRAYLLRDGELFLITQDHTLVRSMVDEGRLTPEEAATHPQRSLLLKALGGGEAPPVPDLRLHDVRPGDRFLLCSDGVFGVITPEALRETLLASPDPLSAARSVIDLALASGAPDNISCAVAHATS